MKNSPIDIQADVKAISEIPIVASLLNVICRTTGMGFAAVARVTEDRWVTCGVQDDISFGLKPGDELKVETTICHEIRQNQQAVIIDNVEKDKTFSCHPTPSMYGFQSYISVPIIRKDGNFFGTLCAIDPRPARLNNPETVGMFRLFSDLISFHLNAIEEVAFSEAKLLEERETAELREQFIAILGHDLRNPLAAVYGSAQLLRTMPVKPDVIKLANIIKDSSYRISGLIDNVLDFARGRLGDGIILNRKDNEPIEKILNQVITELHTAWPDKSIVTQFDIAGPVNCDGDRIAQLFSNLLSNAITHGKADSAVKVSAFSQSGEFILSVANSGKKIPEADINQLFKPFSRREINKAQNGLGLGLYIASEIARAHGGELNVVSTDDETCFSLHIHSK